ncbi:MAG: putative ribosome biogenesis GTPase RsgA [candidate division BRC1 bacterium ADurb.BinA364]|nr:MAG: putative ribosome biogenesis GTPase RsgA [candidate division BRC1 bacterium ADurb.BinA364]
MTDKAQEPKSSPASPRSAHGESAPQGSGALIGVVHRKALGCYDVFHDGQWTSCAVSSKLRKDLVLSTDNPRAERRQTTQVKRIRQIDPVAVGDRVEFHRAADGAGLIQRVLPRSNQLSRKAAHQDREQIIAANIDQAAAIMAAALPWPSWELMDRYLACAELSGMPALVCISKMDLADAEEIERETRVYRAIGYRVVATCALTGEGIEELRGELAGRLTALIGKSGVGKTSLLNALEPGLGLKVGEVSQATLKGRHTTSQPSLHPLACGGAVIDTPGTREFDFWNPGDMAPAWLFREMRPYLGLCRFGEGCAHKSEPGCAIKEAVERGEISARRYESFLQLAQ